MNDKLLKAGLSAATKRWVDSILAVHNIEDHQAHILRAAADALDDIEAARKAQRAMKRKGEDPLTFVDRHDAPRPRPEVKIINDATARHMRAVRELALQPGEARPIPAGDRQGDGAPRKPRLVGRTKRRGA